MRIGRLILACSLTTASGLLLSTSGQTASTISLKPEHANTSAWAFSKKNCDGFPDLLSTLDGWHFVLPKSVNARFISLTLNFNPGNVVVGPITSTSWHAPTPGRGWTGYLASPGDNFQHAYVKVTAGLTLIGGTAQVDPSVAQGSFQISDVCARPSAPPRAQPPSASQSASGAASPSQRGSSPASPSEHEASPSEQKASPSERKASPSERKASPSERKASPSQSQGERSKSPLSEATASALASLKARSQAPSGQPSKPESSAKASSSAQARTATGTPTGPASKAAASSAAKPPVGQERVVPRQPGDPEVGGSQTLAVPQFPALEGNVFGVPGDPGLAPAGGAETGGGGSQSTAFGPGTMALIAVSGLVAFVLRRREKVA